MPVAGHASIRDVRVGGVSPTREQLPMVAGMLDGASQVRLIRVVAEVLAETGLAGWGASWVSPYAGECDARLTGG